MNPAHVYTYRGILPRVLLEDPDALHEIRLNASGGPAGRKGTVMIGVSCKCQHRPLATRRVFPADEAQAVWKAHARDKGMDV